MPAPASRKSRLHRAALGSLAGLSLAGLAACQPPPRPFQIAHHPPAPGDLLAPGPDTGLTIAPLAGAPPAVTRRLPELTAALLLKQGVLASSDSVQGRYLVQGVAEAVPQAAGLSRVTLRWTLIGPEGMKLDTASQSTTLPTAEWRQGYDPALAAMARKAAVGIAALTQKKDGAGTGAPDAAADTTGATLPRSGAPRFLIGRVEGAPGDGNQALARAIGAALSLQGGHIVAAPGQGVLRLSAHVEAENSGDAEAVSIAWTLKDGSGLVLGTVNQRNQVARGRLDHAWGNVAYLAALGAAGGLMQLAAGAPAGP